MDGDTVFMMILICGIGILLCVISHGVGAGEATQRMKHEAILVGCAEPSTSSEWHWIKQ